MQKPDYIILLLKITFKIISLQKKLTQVHYIKCGPPIPGPYLSVSPFSWPPTPQLILDNLDIWSVSITPPISEESGLLAFIACAV